MKKLIFVFLSSLLILSIIACYTVSPTGEPCPPCFGSGKCNQCQGQGRRQEDGRCRTCRGDGKCIACGGSGRYTRISIPGVPN